jgi:hypothetical protein
MPEANASGFFVFSAETNARLNSGTYRANTLAAGATGNV